MKKHLTLNEAQNTLFAIFQYVERNQESLRVLDARLAIFRREHPVTKAVQSYLAGYEAAWRDQWQAKSFTLGYQIDGKTYAVDKIPFSVKQRMNAGERFNSATCWANADGTAGGNWFDWA
jgi:hypothetical protein